MVSAWPLLLAVVIAAIRPVGPATSPLAMSKIAGARRSSSGSTIGRKLVRRGGRGFRIGLWVFWKLLNQRRAQVKDIATSKLAGEPASAATEGSPGNCGRSLPVAIDGAFEKVMNG